MEAGELSKKAEAVLFAAGRKVSLDELKSLCGEDNLEMMREAVSHVKKKLDEDESPLLLTEEADGYKLTVREKFLPLAQQIIPETELGRSVLETLAVIAWKSPVLQSEVIQIRTSNAYEHISQLVDLGFISKIKQGRSFVLKTTQKFAEYFDVPSREKIQEIFRAAEEKYGNEPVQPPEEAEEGLHLGNLEVYDEPEEAGGEMKVETEEEAEPESAAPDEDLNPEEGNLKEPESEQGEEQIEENLTNDFQEDDQQDLDNGSIDVEGDEDTADEEDKMADKDKEKEEEGRKLPDALEDELKTEQPDFLEPKDTRSRIQEEVEGSKEIMEKEEELEKERKKGMKENINIPELEPEKDK